MEFRRTKASHLKILSRMLLGLIILALLAGCNGNAGGGATADPVQTTQGTDGAQDTNDNNKDAADKTQEGTDNASAGGDWRELFTFPKAGEYDEHSLGPMAEPITLKVVHSYTSGETSDLIDKGITPDNCVWLDLVKEQLNITLDYLWYVPSDQYIQRLQLSVSAGDIPDILRMEEREFRNFVETGSLRDLTAAYNDFAIAELHNMDAVFNNAPLKQATVDGKLLAIPRYEDNHAAVNLLYYRKDWADRLGFAKPETIRDLMEMAEAFGNQEEFPLANGIVANSEVFEETHSLGGLYQCFGAYPDKWIVKNGQVVPGVIQDECLTALKEVRSLYAKGALPKDFAGLSGDQAVEMINSSNVGIVFAKWWTPAWPLNFSLQYDTSAVWELMPIPSQEAGIPAISTINENMVQFYIGVYKNAPEHAEEALIRLINYYFVRLFPVSNETWPQEPLPQTEEEHKALVARSEAQRDLGYVWNWLPIMVWNATENSDRARIVNNALKNRDISGLRNTGDKDWYDKSILWLDKGLDDDNFYNNWGTYASRAMTDSGVLLSSRMRDEGYVINNVFYGGATETEEQVASTLKDMAKEYYTKFILGEVSEDSWSGFVNEWLSNGGQSWWDEAVAGYNAIH